MRRHVRFVNRLRLVANLFEPAPQRGSGRGRPDKKGQKLPKLSEVLADPAMVWTTITLTEWYRGKHCRLQTATATPVWYYPSLLPLPIRWVQVARPRRNRKPQAFLRADLDVTPIAMQQWCVDRRALKTTFREAHRHLGPERLSTDETQPQWSDRALVRNTPALFRLFLVITLWAAEAKVIAALLPGSYLWYNEGAPTFSDAIAAVRCILWGVRAVSNISTSQENPDPVKLHTAIMQRLTEALCFATKICAKSNSGIPRIVS